jgi:hypothetical protein
MNPNCLTVPALTVAITEVDQLFQQKNKMQARKYAIILDDNRNGSIQTAKCKIE